MGSHYLIDLNAVACNSGDTLAKEQVEAASKEDVLKALSRACLQSSCKLGESLPSVQKFDVPIEATTSSLEALKNYSMGITIGREKGDAPSIPFLKRAIELDPNFPMAYAGSVDSLREPWADVACLGICHQGVWVARPGHRTGEAAYYGGLFFCHGRTGEGVADLRTVDRELSSRFRSA